MQVKDQLLVRMEQLQVSPPELAKRIGVSAQTVRYWLDGRNFPGKRHSVALEKALSFRLDFSEGNTSDAVPTVNSLMQQVDAEIFLLITSLPPRTKQSVRDLLDAIHRDRDPVDRQADPPVAEPPPAAKPRKRA